MVSQVGRFRIKRKHDHHVFPSVNALYLRRVQGEPFGVGLGFKDSRASLAELDPLLRWIQQVTRPSSERERER